MSNRGYSLLELLTVLIVAGVLAGLGTVNYLGWRTKQDINSQMREMQADLMSIRMMSMTEGVSHFVSLASGQLRVYEDADDNGVLSTASDRIVCMWSRKYGEAVDSSCSGAQSVALRKLSRTITWSGANEIGFNARGLADVNDTICIDYTQTSPVNATYDCIDVSATRIGIGKLTNPGGACASANCQPRK